MTFTQSGIFEKLEDGSKQTRRLPQLSPNHEVGQIPGEVGATESGGSPERARTFPRRSQYPYPNVTVWAEAASRQMRLQLAVMSRRAIKTATAAILKSDDVTEDEDDDDEACRTR